MGFIDQNNYPLINEEQKIRIALSERARLTMSEDMEIFGVNKTTTFLNTVFDNYKADAKSSISLYLTQKGAELERLFSGTELDNTGKKAAITRLLAAEEQEIREEVKQYTRTKGESKLYHINNQNVEYLLNDCTENQYYSRPGHYIRSVIEEYCFLPFIKREQIYKKEVFDTIETACRESRILKIKAPYFGKDQLFYVYPYKIAPDPMHTQSYLVCYSRRMEEPEENKMIASFSMARISSSVTMQKKTFHLTKQEISELEEKLAKYSSAYLIGQPECIKVRLSEKGKKSYHSRLYSRPEKIENQSSDDVYIFHCTQHQIFNYFFPFGAEAEILSPQSLRDRFIAAHQKALSLYAPQPAENCQK